MATISMRETFLGVTRAIEIAKAEWREKPDSAMDSIRFARALLIIAEDALKGELEIKDR